MSPIHETLTILPQDDVTEAATSNYMQSVLLGTHELTDNSNNMLSNSHPGLAGILNNNGLITNSLLSAISNHGSVVSSKSSLTTSSASPPVSPLYGFGPPPSYEQHMSALEQRHVPFQQLLQHQHQMHPVNGSPAVTDNLKWLVGSGASNFEQSKQTELSPLINPFSNVNTMQMTGHVPQDILKTNFSDPCFASSLSTETSSGLDNSSHTQHQTLVNQNTSTSEGHPPAPAYISRHSQNVESMVNPPLSPISESSSGVGNNLSGGNTRSVSAAVSDESVAGDSGVFEASVKRTGYIDKVLESNLESAQIQIKLKYEGLDHQLIVGIEQGRNLSVLPFPKESSVFIKAALLPIQTSCMSTKPLADTKSPKFSETFSFSIPEHKLYSKTLQVHVWSLSPEKKEECLGCAQVSLADFDPLSVSIHWYNVLSFRFMQSEMKAQGTTLPSVSGHSLPSSSSSSEDPKLTLLQSKQKETQDRIHQLLEASSAKLRQATVNDDQSSDSGRRDSTKSAHPLIVSLKEESSDESTIISSQTSTLTRNHGPEDMKNHRFDSPHIQDGLDDDDEDDDEEEEDEKDQDYAEMIQEVLNELAESVDHYDDDELTESVDGQLNIKCDKETNTEVGEYRLREIRASHHHHQPQRHASTLRSSTIRRSQTFSPTCRQQPPGYVCKLNRSDSDSSMPLYKKTTFQRNTMSRRSLRWKRADGSIAIMPISSQLPFRTSLDLELDLQASHTRLSHLNDEITRLKELKRTLEDSKNKGEWELPDWLSENEKFHRLLTMAEKLHTSAPGDKKEYISKQDKRAEHLMRKVTKEVQRMRQGTQQSRSFNFREKMAFFTSVNMDVPVIPTEVLKPAARLPARDDRSLSSQTRDDRPLSSHTSRSSSTSSLLQMAYSNPSPLDTSTSVLAPPKLSGAANSAQVMENGQESYRTLTNQKDLLPYAVNGLSSPLTRLTDTSFSNKLVINQKMMTTNSPQNHAPVTSDTTRSIDQTIGSFFLDNRIGEEV